MSPKFSVSGRSLYTISGPRNPHSLDNSLSPGMGSYRYPFRSSFSVFGTGVLRGLDFSFPLLSGMEVPLGFHTPSTFSLSGRKSLEGQTLHSTLCTRDFVVVSVSTRGSSVWVTNILVSVSYLVNLHSDTFSLPRSSTQTLSFSLVTSLLTRGLTPHVTLPSSFGQLGTLPPVGLAELTGSEEIVLPGFGPRSFIYVCTDEVRGSLPTSDDRG